MFDRLHRKFKNKTEAKVFACVRSKTTHKSHFVCNLQGAYHVITKDYLHKKVAKSKEEVYSDYVVAKFVNGVRFE